MLDLGQYTQQIQTAGDRWTAAALRMIEDAINRLARNVGASATGDTAAPPDIQGVNVKVAGELAHVTISDNSAITRGANYFVEVDTDPSFRQPHVEHLGTSRGRVLVLPTNNDATSQQTYYIRAYSQYQGSKTSKPVVFGGETPTGITMGGTTNLTLLPSTGSGTAAGNGQQGGYGFGRFTNRSIVGPKRSIQA